MQARTVEKKPELCEAFVGGLMEGLKYVYLNPERSVALHIESVKEFQGGSVTNQKVVEYGQAIGTASGHGAGGQAARAGLHGPRSRCHHGDRSKPIWGSRTLPPLDKLFTNKFVGAAKLTETEWSEVEKRSEKYLLRKSS